MEPRTITTQPYEKLTVLLESTGPNTTYEHVFRVPLSCWSSKFSWYVPHFLLIYFPDPQNPSKTAQNSRKPGKIRGKPGKIQSMALKNPSKGP